MHVDCRYMQLKTGENVRARAELLIMTRRGSCETGSMVIVRMPHCRRRLNYSTLSSLWAKLASRKRIIFFPIASFHFAFESFLAVAQQRFLITFIFKIDVAFIMQLRRNTTESIILHVLASTLLRFPPNLLLSFFSTFLPFHAIIYHLTI
jgi:hypothetical protein